jgi:hypothetical protein
MGGAVLADKAAGTAKAGTTGSTKPHPGNGPAEEKSPPSPASRATTAGVADQDKTVRTMNSDEKAKIDAAGK